MGLHVSTLGSIAKYSPNVKRAVCTNGDGEVILLVPDQNISSFNGDGTPSVPGFRLYKVSSDHSSVDLIGEHSTQIVKSNTPAVCSITSDPRSYEYHVVWQDYSDNSLKYGWLTDSPEDWYFETVIPGNSVTNRFRAVDIDIIGDWGYPAIIVYEALNSSGMGAVVKTYVRTDNEEWVEAWGEQLFTTEFIRQGSEDVSISYTSEGKQGDNVRFLVYYTKSSTVADYGDTIRDISYDVSLGDPDSAIVNGSWPGFNASIASGLRRGWLFKVPNGDIQVGMVAGSGQPKFQAMRLTPGTYTTPVVNTNTIPTGVAAGSFPTLPQIDTSPNFFSSVSCSYKNNRLVFGFVTSNTIAYSPSAGKPLLVSLVFRYDDLSSKSAIYVDNQVRPLDGFEQVVDRPIAIYGGDNTGYLTEIANNKFHWVAWYGRLDNDITFIPSVAHFVYNKTLDEPVVVAPSGTQPNDTPLLQVNVQQSSVFYPGALGKVEWNLSRSADFADDPRTITEPDTNFKYYGSISNSAPSPFVVSYKPTQSERLRSGAWYQRARLIDDLGGSSPWSITRSFEISHPPVANPVYPAPGAVVEYKSAGVTFSWLFSDTNDEDFQSAYQVVVVRLDTGTTVIDTGKVNSNNNSVIIILGSELKDIPLQWSVCLWDIDGTQGPFSTPTLFTVSDAVAVAVTSPTNGQIINTARPVVTWSSTFVGNRTQKAYRVLAYEPNVFDAFDRLISGSFGTSSNGIQWSVQHEGPSSDYSVDGSVGKISVTIRDGDYTVVTNTNIKNARQEVVFTPPAVATGSEYTVGLICRYTGPTNYYRAAFVFGTNSQIRVRLEKTVNDISEDISLLTDTGVVYTPGQPCKLIFDVIENQFKIKVHNVSDPEPGSWDVTALDSSINVAGKSGINVFVSFSNSNPLPLQFVFDNYLNLEYGKPPVAETGWIYGQASSFSFQSNIFQNNKFYTIRTFVQDSVGLSGESIATVKTDWAEPDLGDLIVTTDPFSVILNWTNANIDPNFIAWRVYRKYMVPSIPELDEEDTANTWVLIHETSEVKPNYTFRDYLAPLNKEVTYTVVQLVDRFGSLIESDITSTVTVTLTGDRYFFVPSEPIGSIAAFQAKNVTADGFTAEVEQATLHVKGRGRQIQIGDDLGISGSLTIKLRDPETARADREFIQRLASSKTAKVYIKSPFGDVILVRLGNVSVTRIPGVGISDLVDLTVPYTEVYEEVPVTRR